MLGGLKMTRLLGLLALFAIAILPANAQVQSIAVDITKAKLTWQHAEITSVTVFGIYCPAGTLVHTVLPPLTQAPLADFITTPGAYTCEVTASNDFGESTPSNTITFRAGNPPGGPTDLILESQ